MVLDTNSILSFVRSLLFRPALGGSDGIFGKLPLLGEEIV
jgi:hypothetical protein